MEIIKKLIKIAIKISSYLPHLNQCTGCKCKKSILYHFGKNYKQSRARQGCMTKIDTYTVEEDGKEILLFTPAEHDWIWQDFEWPDYYFE